MNEYEMVGTMKLYQWSVACITIVICCIVTLHASAKQQAIIMYKDAQGLAIIEQQHIHISAHYEQLKVVVGTFDDETLTQLAKNVHIEDVETEDIALQPLDTPAMTTVQSLNAPWHVAMMHQPEKTYLGDGVKIGMLDTGVLDEDGLESIDRLSLVNAPADQDINMHGTMVATVLASTNEASPGLVPNSHVYSIKIFDKQNTSDVSTFLEGINTALEKDVDILNLSLGTSKDFPLLHEAVKTAYKKGVLVVAAAGNNGGKKAITYPAAYDEVIAVGAITEKNKRASFSNTGEALEFVAPGEKISGLDGKFYSGTSFASPHVTALLSSLKQQYPSWSAVKLRDYARNYATDLGEAGRDQQFGYGAISYTLQAPTTVSTLKKNAVSTSTIQFQYQMPKAATVPVEKYDIYVNDKRVATTKAKTYKLSKLKANTTYKIAVRAISTAGKKGKFKTIRVKTAKKSTSAQYVDDHSKTVTALLDRLMTIDIRNDYATLYSISDALNAQSRQQLHTTAKKRTAVVLSKHTPKTTFVKTTNLTRMKAKKYSDLTFKKGIRPVASSSYQLKRSGQKVKGYKVKKVNGKTLRLKLPKDAKSGRYAFVLKRDRVKTTANKTLEKHMIMYFDV